MGLAVVTLKKGEGRFLKSGGMWVFDNEIASVMGSFVNGDIVLVHDFDGYPLGRGFINRNSKITVRLLTRNENQKIDEDFFEKRVRDAWEYRKKVTDTSSCRVIFGEADFLPGLVIDRFSDVLVVESLALGIDLYKEQIVDLLKEIMAQDGVKIRGVYERSDAKVRKKEGLAPYKGCIGAEFEPVVEIVENGVHYNVDVANGQKTGFFLDQKYNRRAVRQIAAGRRVLDCFSHVGPFGLNAAAGGAAFVRCIDSSATALGLARENAKLNGFDDRMGFTQADVLEYLPELLADKARLREEGGPFDLIVLDPPAFAKTRKATHGAMRGYRDINYRAMRLLPRGGYLATCSCSHFMTTDLLKKAIHQAAHDANVQLMQVEERQQAPDHPILWGVPETHYLDFFIFRVV